MGVVRDELSNMFIKIMAGTVTREEGTMLINSLAKESYEETMKELCFLIDTPPPGVFSKTILHTIALTRNKAFQNIMISSLEHKNAGVSILAAEELGKLKTADAKEVLIAHLNNEVYHVRQASAAALAAGFLDGMEILRKHVMMHSEPYYRATSAYALLKAGRQGVEILVGILNSGAQGAVCSVAGALASSVPSLEDKDIPKIFESLMSAGDKKETQAVVDILKLIAVLRGRVKGYERYVEAFVDSPYELVRKEATNTLNKLSVS
ncbi:MAG: HEAT repeat domain-containing protein [Deltaproteobacteria bacterium]|nr:HEAT repeat domain-containing protein [Deltaproteobacteria bacterium]